ncbi:hypothetical protein N7540_012349 [Penicillium herquei]|nr:hypothetical protein N7540_012349 [Penicillium herquei]
MAHLLRLTSTQRRTLTSFARKSLWKFPPNPGPPIPQHKLIDEEKLPGYNSGVYYPAKQGELLADKFQLVSKVGFGTQSTVWFARDISRFKWQAENIVALKIVNSNDSDRSDDEKELESHIRQQNPKHPGHLMVRACLDELEVTGPNGKHKCLVYEPMRDPFWLFQDRFVDREIPLPLAKAYMYSILNGLDYLHSECEVVHADLKLDNILMSFEKEDILTDFVKRRQAMEFKVDAEGRTVYLCHNNFGPLVPKDVWNMFPQITDFGNALRLEKPPPRDGMEGVAMGIYPIQPNYYRAPEIILGCGWDFKADIWNFGVMLWNMLGHRVLFQQVQDERGRYDAKAHLAEMIALLGSPPEELLSKSRNMAKHGWPGPIRDHTGKLFHSAEECFGGPFFDAEDKFLYRGLIPDRNLEDTVPFIEKKEREEFLSFVREMLVWLPEKRKTARELMEHPFLASTISE